MKFSTIIILLLLFITKNNYGQEFDRNWPLGLVDYYGINQQANLVFIGNSVQIDTIYREIKFSGACSSISDILGNVRFYSNGCMVANSLNDTMPNGDSLGEPNICQSCFNSGNSIPHGTIIIPYPNHQNQFILFYEEVHCSGLDISPRNLFLSIIDMNLDSGRGDVTYKNNILFIDTLAETNLSAVKHANGIDWWLLVHEKYTDRFIRYLISDSGVSGPYFQNIGRTINNDGHGTSKFSPDGNYYATSSQLGGIDLFHFNRCNGLLSDYTYLSIPDSLWNNSLEFSPNSRFLYSAWLYTITQYDLIATDIASSAQIVAVYDSFYINQNNTWFGIAQLAPNNKIYLSCLPGNTYLHVIDQPDSLGTACNVLLHGLYVPSYNSTVPNFPNYRLGPLDSLYCDTINSVHDYISAERAISVFPNPANNEIHIQCENENEKILQITISNSFGKIVYQKNVLEQAIDISKFSPGFYSIHIRTADGNYIKKLIIQ